MKTDDAYFDMLDQRVDDLLSHVPYEPENMRNGLMLIEITLLKDIAHSLRGLWREQVKQKTTTVNNYSVTSSQTPEEIVEAFENVRKLVE